MTSSARLVRASSTPRCLPLSLAADSRVLFMVGPNPCRTWETLGGRSPQSNQMSQFHSIQGAFEVHFQSEADRGRHERRADKMWEWTAPAPRPGKRCQTTALSGRPQSLKLSRLPPTCASRQARGGPGRMMGVWRWRCGGAEGYWPPPHHHHHHHGPRRPPSTTL